MKKSSRTLSWGGSLILVVGLHVALFVWALYWQPQAKPIELPPAAMMVELEPLAAPAPAAPPPPEVVPEEPEPQPKLVEAPKPKLAITPPKPKPKPKPKPPKPAEPTPPAKPQENPPADTPPAPVAVADSKPAAPQQANISAPSQAEVTWQSKLISHLSKYKRYPDDARRRGIEGVNRLHLVIDGNGKVVSYSLTGKSGSASLDRATLQMIRRAQPLPAPPAEMLKGGTVEIVAPFIYALDRR